MAEHKRKLEAAGAGERVAKAEAQQARKELQDSKGTLQNARMAAAEAQRHVEELTERLNSSSTSSDATVRELMAAIRTTEDENDRLMHEVEAHKSTMAARAMQLDQLKEDASADREAMRNQLEEQQHELKEAKVEARTAARAMEQMETRMETALGQLKSELATSGSNLEASALAGLGLTEMLSTLKEEHAAAMAARDDSLAAATAERDRLAVELDDVQKQLDARNETLTEVMHFLQSQNAGGDGDDDEDEAEPEGLQERMERLVKRPITPAQPSLLLARLTVARPRRRPASARRSRTRWRPTRPSAVSSARSLRPPRTKLATSPRRTANCGRR